MRDDPRADDGAVQARAPAAVRQAEGTGWVPLSKLALEVRPELRPDPLPTPR